MRVTDSKNKVRLFMEVATEDTHAVFNALHALFNALNGILGNLL